MDRDTLLHQFGIIERKIASLIDRCNQLEAANTELSNKNEAFILQLEEKRAAEKQNEEIKALVISKIDGLMGRLNEFAED